MVNFKGLAGTSPSMMYNKLGADICISFQSVALIPDLDITFLIRPHESASRSQPWLVTWLVLDSLNCPVPVKAVSEHLPHVSIYYLPSVN